MRALLSTLTILSSIDSSKHSAACKRLCSAISFPASRNSAPLHKVKGPVSAPLPKELTEPFRNPFPAIAKQQRK